MKKCAKDICAKYINPPKTTDFALMFLPTEGLYAEAIRRVGSGPAGAARLPVTFVGPTTLAALLNSLQMGFRTLAIQKRSERSVEFTRQRKDRVRKIRRILDVG